MTDGEDRDEEPEDEKESRFGGGFEYGAMHSMAALVDGVFAIVMTLLVLDIEVPQIPDEQLDEQLRLEVLYLWPRILAYVVSFMNLAIFWIGYHSQLNAMRRVNYVILWLSMIFLMMVSLVPFTTGLVGQFGNQEIALWIYAANFMAMSALLMFAWRYADAKGFLKDSVDRAQVRDAARKSLIGPAIYSLGILLSFFDPLLGLGLFMLVPILHLMPGPIQLYWTRSL